MEKHLIFQGNISYGWSWCNFKISSFPAPLKLSQVLQQENSFTNLLQNDLPGVEPLEVDESEDEVEDGGDDDKDGQLPAQPGQQVEGLVLLGERPNVVAEGQVLLSHFGRWNWQTRYFKLSLKLTCQVDGAKHEKVGEHLQQDHPHRLVQNRLPLLDLHLGLFVVVPLYEGVPNASSSFS